MECFEYDIEHFKTVDARKFDRYYSRLFGISIVRMLKILDIRENQFFKCNETQKKEYYQSHLVEIIDFGYISSNLPIENKPHEDYFRYDGKWYAIIIHKKNSEVEENFQILPLCDLYTWHQIYGWLQPIIEASIDDRYFYTTTEYLGYNLSTEKPLSIINTSDAEFIFE